MGFALLLRKARCVRLAVEGFQHATVHAQARGQEAAEEVEAAACEEAVERGGEAGRLGQGAVQVLQRKCECHSLSMSSSIFCVETCCDPQHLYVPEAP